MVDYGDYSRDLYVIMHGTVGIEIPNKNFELQIPINHLHECKLEVYVYCIQNFEKIAWKVMQDELVTKRPFDLSAQNNLNYGKCKVESQLRSLIK